MFLVSLWFIILLLTSVFYLSRKPSKFPPGPSWLPIIGCMLYFKRLQKALGPPHLVLQEMSRKWGSDIIGYKMGEQLIVSVSSFPLIKTVLNGEDFNGRPNNYFGQLRRITNAEGLTCADGEVWVEQRGFVHKHLRDLGFGKDTTTLKIKQELIDAVDFIHSNPNKVDIPAMLAFAVLNTLETLVYGNRFDKNDPRVDKFLRILEERNRAFDMSGGLMSQYPWLRFIMPEKIGYNLIKRINSQLKTFIVESIEEHKKTWTEGNKSDIIYSFLTKMKETEGQVTNFTLDQLIMVSLDLFLAGTHTASTMLSIIFIMMILNPDIQEKAQKVLDEAFDKDYELTYSDRQKVPYIEALISEIERYGYVIPISATRRALVDTVLDGYRIPKDTTILINQYCVMRNTELWGDPEEFRPERFLNEQGNYFCPQEMVPFGIGKRRCLGEPLARSFIFLFFSEILRKYTIKPSPGTPLPTINDTSGIFCIPKQYYGRFVQRKV